MSEPVVSIIIPCYNEEKTFRGKLRWSKAVMLHLLKHSRDAFPHFSQVTQVGERPNDQRVAGKVNGFTQLQLFEGDGRRRETGASDLDPIIEHPNFDARAGNAVIPVRNRIDQRFLHNAKAGGLNRAADISCSRQIA